jgi:alpha-L-fucosidase
MTKQERIESFKKLGFGIFVHFGLYSVLGRGEWAKSFFRIGDAEYEALTKKFNPKKNWAEKLVAAAKNAGAKYVNLTTRHHDGFSLYDTKGLGDYDAPHVCGRDLIREFVDACNRHGIVPFFYHTTLDWRHPLYQNNFKEYLKYLRGSIEILCKNYGKIGGLWFDGNWDKKDADWEEDALYAVIRKYQPDAIIVNNTGLEARGAGGRPEIDSVTFERGRPDSAAANGLASEMCETIGGTWGYSARDIDCKSMRDLLTSYMTCKRYGANFLLNVGPTGDGLLPDGCKDVLQAFGIWNKIYSEAIANTRLSVAEISGEGFLLTDGKGNFYLFKGDIHVSGDANVTLNSAKQKQTSIKNFKARAKRIFWLDNGEALSFEHENELLTIHCTDFDYDTNYIWRVAKIETEA